MQKTTSSLFISGERSGLPAPARTSARLRLSRADLRVNHGDLAGMTLPAHALGEMGRSRRTIGFMEKLEGLPLTFFASRPSKAMRGLIDSLIDLVIKMQIGRTLGCLHDS